MFGVLVVASASEISDGWSVETILYIRSIRLHRALRDEPHAVKGR